MELVPNLFIQSHPIFYKAMTIMPTTPATTYPSALTPTEDAAPVKVAVHGPVEVELAASYGAQAVEVLPPSLLTLEATPTLGELLPEAEASETVEVTGTGYTVIVLSVIDADGAVDDDDACAQ